MYYNGHPHMAGQKQDDPARTYIQQLCEDTKCSHEDLPEAMNERGKMSREGQDIRACGTTWWWWLLLFPGNHTTVCQANDYYQIEIIAWSYIIISNQIRILDTIWLLLFNRNTWSHIITSIRSEYLKLCNCVQIICIR